MRILLVFGLILAALLGIAWLGGESWMAGRAVAAIDARDDLAATAVEPLRDWRRIGLRVAGAEYRGTAAGRPAALHLPWLDLWVAPSAPNEFHATLPDTAELALNGAKAAIGMHGAQALLRVAPTSNLALSRAAVQARSVMLGNQPAIGAIAASARLVPLGHDAPPDARAAYDISLRLDRADPARLAQLGVPVPALPGAVSADGGMRLWLDAAPGRGLLQGRAATPRVVGIRTTGLTLGLGDLSARLLGEVTADDQSRATGRLALYTTDAQGWLGAAADAGMIPRSGVLLGGAMLRTLSATPMPPDAAPITVGSVPTERNVAEKDGLAFPQPAEDELRLPIFLRDGKVFLGTIPIGPAPSFPRS